MVSHQIICYLVRDGIWIPRRSCLTSVRTLLSSITHAFHVQESVFESYNTKNFYIFTVCHQNYCMPYRPWTFVIWYRWIFSRPSYDAPCGISQAMFRRIQATSLFRQSTYRLLAHFYTDSDNIYHICGARKPLRLPRPPKMMMRKPTLTYGTCGSCLCFQNPLWDILLL